MENLDQYQIENEHGSFQESVFERNRTLEVQKSQMVPVYTQEQVQAYVEDKISEIEKSRGGRPAPLISSFFDPWNNLDFQGARTKPSRVTWQILRRMALGCKPVSAIIRVRQNQIASFTQVPRKPGEIGFRITTLNPKAVPTESQRRRIKEVQDFLLRTGYPVTHEEKYTGDERTDNFDTFMRKMINDTLTLDATVFEKQTKRNGDLHAIWAIDGSSIKFASTNYQFDPITAKPYAEPPEYTNGLPVKYVQELVNGQRVATYNCDELAYEIMNPRTDIDVAGYGLSPLEILMETVTCILFGEQYNQKYFTQNSVPQGVLNIAGKYNEEALEAFKRQWVAQVAGVANAWRVPIMAIDEKGGGVNWVPFKQTNKDMEYHLWLEYLIQTACAIFCIDPSEIGYLIKGGGGAPLVENSGAVKIDFSKDKGLRPLMKFYQHIFQKHVVEAMYDDLYFEWVGADPITEATKIEIVSKKIQTGLMTVNEARALEDMDEIPESWANAPAHATLAQIYLKDKEQEAQEAQAKAVEAQQAGQPVPAGGGEVPPAEGQPAGNQPEGAPPEQGGGQPPAPEGGATPPPAGAPAPAGEEVPPELKGLNPKVGDVELPMRQRATKNTETPEYKQAREKEKQNKKNKRVEAKEGAHVQKSYFVDEEDVIEVNIDIE